MSTIPHYKISYAQHFEDLVLRGILRNVKDGIYVDVGANDPELDSVTKIFYDSGWHGINVEPNRTLWEKLCEARPRDINLNCGASCQEGTVLFRLCLDADGLSSANAEAWSEIETSKRSYIDEIIAVKPLRNILAEHLPNTTIHFLKIDTEGLELEVILGNDWSKCRPWVLCIERTTCIERTSQLMRRNAIFAYLASAGYEQVFFDGINDFFVANEHATLWSEFDYAREIILDGVPVNYIFVKAMAKLAQKN